MIAEIDVDANKRNGDKRRAEEAARKAGKTE